MQNIEINLNRYLAVEMLLNEFFSALDYCLPKCITVEKEKSGNRPVAACCQNKYYALHDLPHPVFERLRVERERRFGKPEAYAWAHSVSPCQYHDPDNGCLLATHKSPICLSFLCREGIDHLRSRYGIYTYDFQGIYYALEWILTGDLTDEQYLEFKESILAMTRRVKSCTSSCSR
jgi:hypothetical protein